MARAKPKKTVPVIETKAPSPKSPIDCLEFNCRRELETIANAKGITVEQLINKEMDGNDSTVSEAATRICNRCNSPFDSWQNRYEGEKK